MMNTMKTENNHVKDKFLDWAEGNLTDLKNKAVNHHLKNCESCASYYRAMESVFMNPEAGQLPTLEKDPYLPVRIKAMAGKDSAPGHSRLFGLRKSIAGLLVAAGLLVGFLLGQQLVYTAYDDQEPVSYASVEEMYYEGIAQPNLGTQYEQFLTEIGGEQR